MSTTKATTESFRPKPLDDLSGSISFTVIPQEVRLDQCAPLDITCDRKGIVIRALGETVSCEIKWPDLEYIAKNQHKIHQWEQRELEWQRETAEAEKLKRDATREAAKVEARRAGRLIDFRKKRKERP